MMTSDGVVLSRVDTALRALHPNAVDEGGEEREYFFDSEADTAVMVDEYWNWRKVPGRPHEAVEIEATTVAFGSTVSLTPAVPQFTAIDDSRGMNTVLKLRAFAADYTIERHSLELLG